MTEQTKAEPVGEVYRHGKDSHGRQWHGIHWYDPNLDVPTGTKLFIHAPYQTNPWRDAVDHELSTLHMVASDDPRESIRRLINWHCAVQIDPLVSSAAQELIERGKPAWVPVTEALPESGVKVLACYRNRLGNLRRIRAEWVAAKTRESDSEEVCSEYDEASDTYYVPKGWYECIDNWGDYSSVVVTEGEVTHWMPLPEEPKHG